MGLNEVFFMMIKLLFLQTESGGFSQEERQLFLVNERSVSVGILSIMLSDT